MSFPDVPCPRCGISFIQKKEPTSGCSHCWVQTGEIVVELARRGRPTTLYDSSMWHWDTMGMGPMVFPDYTKMQK